MKIRFLITNAYGVGGTIRTTYNVAGELAKRHDVEIVSVNRNRKAPAFQVPPGVKLRYLNDRSEEARAAAQKRRGLARLRVLVGDALRAVPSFLAHKNDFRYTSFSLFTDLKLIRYIRSLDGGVLVGTRAALNLMIARLAPPEVVAVGQEHLNLTKYKPALKDAYRQLYPHLDVYATLTERDAAAFRKLLGPEANVVSIPNGIPAGDGPQSDNSSKIVVAAGRLTTQKGFDRLIPAWAMVHREHPDWELRIFGGGKLKKKLEQLIEEAGVEDSARLMGYTEELPEELARASFYVMSSRFEGFPMVLLEAMATALPVVSFDCPNGPRDLISEGEDGFVVPNGDIEALAGALRRMIELGDEERRAFGAAAYAKSQEYRIDAVAVRWEQLFEELVEAHRSGRRKTARSGGLLRALRPGASR